MQKNHENMENNEQKIQDFSEETSEKNTEEKNEADSKLQNKINELEQKNSDLNDKLLRTLAELDNTRRRSREDLEKSAKFAITNFVSDLVLVVENFFLASENAPKAEIDQNPAIKNYADAIVMTEKELFKVLEKNQVKRIYPLNQKFDHHFHEAISQIESEAEEGSVVKVIQAGYTVSDRLIRPALVAVAKPKN